MEINEIYDYMIERGLCSEETLRVITCINGYNEETLNDVLSTVTEYRDMEQYTYYEDRETYNEYFNKEDEEDDE